MISPPQIQNELGAHSLLRIQKLIDDPWPWTAETPRQHEALWEASRLLGRLMDPDDSVFLLLERLRGDDGDAYLEALLREARPPDVLRLCVVISVLERPKGDARWRQGLREMYMGPIYCVGSRPRMKRLATHAQGRRKLRERAGLLWRQESTLPQSDLIDLLCDVMARQLDGDGASSSQTA